MASLLDNNNPWSYGPRGAKTDQQAAGLTATCRSRGGRSSNQNGVDHRFRDIESVIPGFRSCCNKRHYEVVNMEEEMLNLVEQNPQNTGSDIGRKV
ncbi:hypothetical protein ANN_02924 [Periplaneta americana]|uniref:Uncharacterized protein n=1 Tax=Periplaneta americana TaxID=6978 RepID=A0ABQ8TZ98_PERAM|nr:hypothetical protein ANN_02924 [Periplaneta americana]